METMKFEQVTDFTTCYIQMFQHEFHALPQIAQDLLQLYGSLTPMGWGKPCVIEIPTYRLEEIEEKIKKSIDKTA